MRYLAAFLYGVAAAQGAGILLNALGAGLCVGLGTLAALFAVEGIVKNDRETRP